MTDKPFLISMDPVRFGDWIVKGSYTDVESFCITLYHIQTGAVKVRFFSDEQSASTFIEHVIDAWG